MRRRVVSRPRVDEKGGKNQFPRSGQLAAIHLPSHDLEISGISKERRICVQKTDGFTPLRPSLAFNPLFHQSPLFFSFFFFYTESLLLPYFSCFFPSFFPRPRFFFFSLPSLKRLPQVSWKIQWTCRICIIRVPLWFHPCAGLAARWSSEIRKKFTCLPRHFAHDWVSPSLFLSLSLCFVRFKASRRGEEKRKEPASDFTPNQRFFTQFLREFSANPRERGRGRDDSDALGIGSRFFKQTLAPGF